MFISRNFCQNCKRKIPQFPHCGEHSVENEKISLTKKIFRQINSLVTYLLVKMLISRNFCQKSVRENFRNFHTVPYTVWKNTKFSHRIFFREISSLVITLLSRNFYQKKG